MTRWRLVALALLLALIGGPLAVPFVAAFQQLDRLGVLALNTLAMVAGTLVLSVPLGVLGAILLYRTDLPGRYLFRFLLVLLLFVPPTLTTTAWQATLAHGGWLFALLGHDGHAPLLVRGLLPAIFIATSCALPWVTWFLGQALGWVETELEEEALLHASPWRVLWHVTLPRCRASVAAVAFWVGLQTATDVGITDVMQVRTFGEEVFLELWESRPGALERCVLLALPQIALTLALLCLLLPRFERSLPPLAILLRPPLLFMLGKARWLWALVITVGFLLLAGVPIGSLVWKLGLRGAPPEWSEKVAVQYLQRAWHQDGWLTASSLLVALGAGAAIAALALVLCWLMRGSRTLAVVVFGILGVAWALPAPVVGIGLKEAIRIIVEAFPSPLVTVPLYHGPSPLPILWAQLLRFLPCAMAVLWPLVRLLPRDLEETLRLDGSRPTQELRHFVLPLTWRFGAGAALVVAALSLGEVGAVAMRVETPGWDTLTHVLFDRLHYGVQNEVAALCLLLLAMLLGLGLAWKGWLVLWQLWRRGTAK